MDIHSTIKQIADEALAKINTVSRQYVAETILGNAAIPPAVTPVAAAKPAPKSTSKPSKAKAPKPAGEAREKKPGGEKRDPAVLAEIAGKFLAHVKANTGQGIEEIAKALVIPTKELNLPVRKLVKAGNVKTQGEKRATKYFFVKDA